MIKVQFLCFFLFLGLTKLQGQIGHVFLIDVYEQSRFEEIIIDIDRELESMAKDQPFLINLLGFEDDELKAQNLDEWQKLKLRIREVNTKIPVLYNDTFFLKRYWELEKLCDSVKFSLHTHCENFDTQNGTLAYLQELLVLAGLNLQQMPEDCISVNLYFAVPDCVNSIKSKKLLIDKIELNFHES